MMKKLNLAAILTVFTFAFSFTQAAHAHDVPDAQVAVESTSVAVGLGVTWGDGEVDYKGEKHAIEVSGMSVVDLGISSLSVSGDVYHLNKLEDLNGTYFAVSAGIAVAGGGEAQAMKNQNGVVIMVTSAQEGVKLKFGADGIKIKIKE